MENTNVQENNNIVIMLAEAVEGLDEFESKEKGRNHDWGTENITVRTLLKRYQEEKIILPIFQRLYVWTEEKRKELFESVKLNLPCGTIIVGECDGIQYLLDGLQRTTSLMILSNDQNLSKEERSLILNYKITLTVIHDMTPETMKHYFSVLNSGVALATTVKERSKLSDELNELILTVSSHGMFRKISEYTNKTFNKSHHHELIAINALLAVSNIDITHNKAKYLCQEIKDNAALVVQGKDSALAVIDRIENIYDRIEDKGIIKRSMNANFVGILCHVLAKENFTDDEIILMINYIFSGKKAIKAYSDTTSSSAGDAYKCQQRYNVLVDLLNDPEKMEIVNEEAFSEFCEINKEEIIKSHKDKSMVFDFSELDEDERRGLYLAQRDGKKDVWDSIVENTYNRLEAECV